MTTERENKTKKLASLSQYLAELSVLVGRGVTSEELLSLEDTELLRDKFKGDSDDQLIRVNISFETRKSEAFAALINRMSALNPSSVVLWPSKANDCGPLPLNSMREINFEFPFESIPEGILAIATSDGVDRMLLDFYEEQPEHFLLEIELRGPNWTQVPLGDLQEQQ